MGVGYRPYRGRVSALLFLLVCAAFLTGRPPAAGGEPGWPAPNLNLASTRSVPDGGIGRSDVRRLRLAWRFRLPIRPGYSGALTATPVVAGGVVYLQDMRSNVYAIDLATGTLRWRDQFSDTNPGPDGVTVVGDRVYGATDTTAFALDAATGHLLWTQDLVRASQPFVDMAPQVANGLVYVSTIGQVPDGRGELYAIDAGSGVVRWRFKTIKAPWAAPSQAGGGGSWYPPSVAGGVVYWGTDNPLPWGGSKRYPNGAMFAGPALYTDSMLALDAKTGRLLWYDQVTAHDVRDYDFELSPIVGSIGSTPALFGAGKAGIVVAWNRDTHRRIWQTTVGRHHDDTGPLPTRPSLICPGLYGGVLTPMALADGRLFVPVVNLCMYGDAYGYESLEGVDVAKRGTGEFDALDARTGRILWRRTLPQPDFGCATVSQGVVFSATYDGVLYGFDTATGRTLWRIRMPAGINSCPSVAGRTLLVGAGITRRRGSALLEAFTPAAS